MSLSVKNTQRVLFVLNMPLGAEFDPKAHPYLQPTRFEAAFVESAREDHPGGVRLIEKQLPASLTWLPGESKDGLPDALLHIPEFQRARNERKLTVIQHADPEPTPSPPAAADGNATADAAHQHGDR